MTKLNECHLEITPNSTLEQLSGFGDEFARWQKNINWWIGDLARYAEARWPETHHQIWPEWISPGLVARCRGVAEAYAIEDRNPLATWTIHATHAGRPDRLERVAKSVEAGRTSDEERAAAAQANAEDKRARWLLAIDCNYYLHRFWFSGAGVEAAVGVAQWIQRTVERLKEKGLTDVVCAFDSLQNNRKELTKTWEDKYKDRPPKDPELVQQLHLVRELLNGHGFCCCDQLGFEADDVLASCAARFPGKVTILSQDKDVKQCLSDTCNILQDVVWTEDETGEASPEYKWVTAKTHYDATGLTPQQWIDYQCIMGDNVDGIKGAIGIGEKGAADLIRIFGSAEAAIEAAKRQDDRIKEKKRGALTEFEPKLDVTRQLVTLKTTLDIPTNTRI